MKKTIIVIILFLSVSGLQAQNDSLERKERWNKFKEKITFGGGVGFGGTNQFLILQVNPIIGYRINENALAGLRLNYTFIGGENAAFNQHIFGGGPLIRYNLFNPFFAQAEYEILNFQTNSAGDREFIGNFMVGGGMNSGVFNFTFLYIVNYDSERTPYPSPIILRGGFMF